MKFIKKYKDIIIYTILLVAYAVFILFRSPLSPKASIIPGSDSSVFMYMAQGMERGLVPYKDLFDHKGMLVYIIDWISMSMFNGTLGIWIFEIIFMLVDFMIIWKLVKLFTKNNMIAFFTILITFIPYMTYYGGGNRVEEWALPFIFAIIYICIKHLKTGLEIKRKEWIINGIATAAVLWLKPNMVIVDIVFIGAIAIKMLLSKQWKDIGRAIVYFFVGIGIVSLPIMIYLVSNNALKHCFNCYILFNLEYVGDKGSILSVLQYAIEYWSLTVLSSLSFIICILGLVKYNKDDENRIILICNAIFIVLSFIIAAMSGRDHSYYALICIPTFTFPTFYALNHILKDKKQGITTFIIVICIIIIIFCKEINTLVNLVLKAHNGTNSNEKVIAEYVKDNTQEDDEVIVLGNKSIINLLSQRTSSSKYFFQISIADIDKDIAKEFLKWLKTTEPKMIVSYIEESTKQDSEFREKLFAYLDSAVKKEEYTKNKDVVKGIIIYEKVK